MIAVYNFYSIQLQADV